MQAKPKFKICRRLGPGVFDKCQTPKFSSASGKFAGPNARRPKALSEYGTQFLEKQKVRMSYGITERQLSNYVQKASHVKGAGTAEKFFEDLESRLDNVVYRMGLAASRRAARQMVSHGHFLVNGTRVTVPSYAVKQGDTIGVREGSKSSKLFTGLEEKFKEYSFPSWLTFDPARHEGKMTAKPANTDTFFDLNAVLEFYSR